MFAGSLQVKMHESKSGSKKIKEKKGKNKKLNKSCLTEEEVCYTS